MIFLFSFMLYIFYIVILDIAGTVAAADLGAVLEEALVAHLHEDRGFVEAAQTGGAAADHVGLDFGQELVGCRHEVAVPALDDERVPDRVQVGGRAEEGDLHGVAALVVPVAGVQRLVDVADEVRQEDQRAGLDGDVEVALERVLGVLRQSIGVVVDGVDDADAVGAVGLHDDVGLALLGIDVVQRAAPGATMPLQFAVHYRHPRHHL